MHRAKQCALLILGLIVGGGVVTYYHQGPKRVEAASNDRQGDYVMATGSVSLGPRSKTDGVWLLDYRAGKLLGTVIDRNRGKIIGWAEVDLVTEFTVAPRSDVRFMMTTGQINENQAALYVAETVSGKFGVYTMGPRPDGLDGIIINRHDMVKFREAKQE